jgi:hypothetical protein
MAPASHVWHAEPVAPQALGFVPGWQRPTDSSQQPAQVVGQRLVRASQRPVSKKRTHSWPALQATQKLPGSSEPQRASLRALHWPVSLSQHRG